MQYRVRGWLLVGVGGVLWAINHVRAFTSGTVTGALLLSYALAVFLTASGVLVLFAPRPRRAVIGLLVGMLFSVALTATILRQTFS